MDTRNTLRPRVTHYGSEWRIMAAQCITNERDTLVQCDVLLLCVTHYGHTCNITDACDMLRPRVMSYDCAGHVAAVCDVLWRVTSYSCAWHVKATRDALRPFAVELKRTRQTSTKQWFCFCPYGPYLAKYGLLSLRLLLTFPEQHI